MPMTAKFATKELLGYVHGYVSHNHPFYHANNTH